MFLLNSALIHASGRIEIVIHLVSENRFGSHALILYLLVLHLVHLDTILFIGVHDVIKSLPLFLDGVNLASVSLEHVLVAVSNIPLELGSLIIKFAPAVIFNPFSC